LAGFNHVHTRLQISEWLLVSSVVEYIARFVMRPN
jgi:hypothetical protein